MTSILATLCSCRFASRHSISVCYSRPPFVSLTMSVPLSAHSVTRYLTPSLATLVPTEWNGTECGVT